MQMVVEKVRTSIHIGPVDVPSKNPSRVLYLLVKQLRLGCTKISSQTLLISSSITRGWACQEQLVLP
jgi:hypothetical protein